jgi:hypothetical protein
MNRFDAFAQARGQRSKNRPSATREADVASLAANALELEYQGSRRPVAPQRPELRLLPI